MNEENKIGYYAIIPSTILFNANLKANEKLLYAVITVLSNKEGYCFASNTYLGNLFNAKPHTISDWVSHLNRLGFVYVDIIKNEKNEVIQRRIYPNDTPYAINKEYPYAINKTESMLQKQQDNIINNNKIDRFYYYIINKEQKIPEEFDGVESTKIFNALSRFDMLYSKDNVEYISKENLSKIKEIMYIIGLLVKNNYEVITRKNFTREKLIKIYNDCKEKQLDYEGTDYAIDNFIRYFYRSVVNELTRNKDPSFFMPKKEENLEEGEEI